MLLLREAIGTRRSSSVIGWSQLYHEVLGQNMRRGLPWQGVDPSRTSPSTL